METLTSALVVSQAGRWPLMTTFDLHVVRKNTLWCHCWCHCSAGSLGGSDPALQWQAKTLLVVSQFYSEKTTTKKTNPTFVITYIVSRCSWQIKKEENRCRGSHEDQMTLQWALETSQWVVWKRNKQTLTVLLGDLVSEILGFHFQFISRCVWNCVVEFYP